MADDKRNVGSQEKVAQSEKAPLFQNEFTSSRRIIYTPSVFARSTLLYLQEVGKLTAIRPHVSSRSNLASYLFFTVNSGKGKLEYQGQQYELKAGDCVFIDCRNGYKQVASDHTVVEVDKDGKQISRYDELWSLSWIHFDGTIMNAVMSKYRERGGKTIFQCESPHRYQELTMKIFELASSDSYVRDMQIAEKLTCLLGYLMEDAWEQESADAHAAPKRKIVKDIKEYIDLNYKERMSLESLAGQFYVNKEYLAQIFKEEYGFTVNGYISQVRVTKAKNLLRFTDDTMDAIGAAVGIEDGNYFARVFKRVEGISPSEYRKSW